MPAAPAVPPVEAMPSAADDQAVEVLAEAFVDYPMLRYLIGVEGDAFAGRLRVLLTFFVAARRARVEPLLGVRADDGWAAVALATLPDAVAPPGALDAARERTWTLLGAAARARYEDLGRRWQRLAVAEPHLHLNLVGVRSAHRGRGLGVALVQAVVDRSRSHPTSCGVSLTTETEANVGFYQALGFEVRGEVEAAPGLRSWVMFRPT
jgi:ribosomal protein S18 acetylase RimI-like enzyme